MSEADWQQLETLFDTSPHLVAVGECGLDYHRNFSSPDNQRQVFARQLALASKYRRPVFAHLREASDDFLAIVKEYRRELVGLCVHCFTDGPDVLEALLELDCDIGVTGWICDERRNHALTQAIGLIPDDRLMLETDAPYLLPRNLPNKPKNGRNEPCFLPHICREVAKLRRQPAEAVARTTTENAMRFFHLNVDEGQRRFFPFFSAQFLGAFNDNVFRVALATWLVYIYFEGEKATASTWINVAQALFILPFFLFSATAGQLADKYDKATVIRWVKAAEIVIMACAALAFW